MDLKTYHIKHNQLLNNRDNKEKSCDTVSLSTENPLPVGKGIDVILSKCTVSLVIMHLLPIL